MKIFNETGRLTEEGKKATAQFREIAKLLLAAGETVSEVYVISSLLSNMVGDASFDEMMKRKK